MIKIICVGKLKEKFFRDASEEYLKRISKYANISIIELDDSTIADEKIALRKERDLILNKINEKDYIITLDINALELNSVDFSNKIKNTLISNSNITFVVGGSYGLHEDVKNKSNCGISFSKMTFPHQLFRVILLEQIYRAFKIINHEKYHK